MKDYLLPNPLQTLLLLLFSSLLSTIHAFENDFSAYPSGSQACLYTSANSSGCTGDTGTDMNTCLCSNGGNFIYNVASCVAKSSPSDLETVYATLENNCEGTGNIIRVGEPAFLAQASAATETTTTASRTATATATTTDQTSTGTATATATTTSGGNSDPTSTNASDSDSGSLSTGAKIGLGAGIGLGSIACVLGAVFIWIYNRRRRPNTKAYLQTGDGDSPHPGEEYSSAFGSSTQGLSSPYPPSSAIPLSASTGWGGGTMNTVSSMGTTQSIAAGGLFYKPQDAQNSQQPLLEEAAELGTEQPRGPVELYAPHVAAPDAGSHLTPGFRAELPGGEVSPDRYQTPPGSHSPYSPPYERSHF